MLKSRKYFFDAILKTQANPLRICPLICVKEFAFGSPKFFATQKNFLNTNIKLNSEFCSKQMKGGVK